VHTERQTRRDYRLTPKSSKLHIIRRLNPTANPLVHLPHSNTIDSTKKSTFFVIRAKQKWAINGCSAGAGWIEIQARWLVLKIVFLGVMAERTVTDFQQFGSFCPYPARLLQGHLEVPALGFSNYFLEIDAFVGEGLG
jgi:hypothetical protein